MGCLRVPAPGKGIGMRTMQDRVDLLGGRLEIDATPGKGTLVSIRVPLRPLRPDFPIKSSAVAMTGKPRTPAQLPDALLRSCSSRPWEAA
jgi:hypothetical protein